jgi:Kef-type K+ transport system membrane component KefB
MLIALGVVVGVSTGKWDVKYDFILKVFGTVGLILIVLEAALDLKLLKEKVGVIIKSLAVSIIGLGFTSYISALLLSSFITDFELIQALLVTIPLSILSSAIILPSIEDLEEEKKEFMIYESTFSDILGIISFYSILSMNQTTSETSEVYGFILSNLMGTIVFSVIVSYILIYIFQNLKGHAKLFLLISVLLVLYALGKMMHLSSLIIILIFGLILNNYKLFFRGFLKDFIIEKKIENILDDFKLVTVESAFVVRTFFFILFGWSISFNKLTNLKSFLFAIGILSIIYIVRAIVLFVFNGTLKIKKISLELFLAPRGLITILLFYAIPKELLVEGISDIVDGILLYVILISCLVMTWSMIREKRKLEKQEEEDFEVLETVVDEEEFLDKEG